MKDIVGMIVMTRAKYWAGWVIMTPSSFYFGQDTPPLIYHRREISVFSDFELCLVHLEVLDHLRFEVLP